MLKVDVSFFVHLVMNKNHVKKYLIKCKNFKNLAKLLN